MAEFDYAIVGTSLLSGLISGVLARDHGKKVARIGRPRCDRPYRSRPATWRMCGAPGEPRALGSMSPEAQRPVKWKSSALPNLQMIISRMWRLVTIISPPIYRAGPSGCHALDIEAIERRLVANAAGAWPGGDVDAEVIVSPMTKRSSRDRGQPQPSFQTSTLVVSSTLCKRQFGAIDRASLAARPAHRARDHQWRGRCRRAGVDLFWPS
jgi:hypothetical protein